jgi:hypothetical protein
LACTCRGRAQEFFANYTLIHSISVWRPASQVVNAIPRHLYITDVLPNGTPNTDAILLGDSPLVILNGDGVNPVEYRWVFDPPFALPHKGTFFFDLLAERFDVFSILATKVDRYPDGSIWDSDPVALCNQPGGVTVDPDLGDFAFEIQFCVAGATPTRATTWGAVKTIYR